MRQGLEQREVSDRSNQQACHDDGFTTDFVGECPKNHEEGGANNQRGRNQNVGGGWLDFNHFLQEEQGVELAGVPNNCLSSG